MHQVRWSYREDGFVRSWLNGRQIVDYRGPVGYNDEVGPKFKFGLYRDNKEPTSVIYHDSYRRGRTCEDVVPPE